MTFYTLNQILNLIEQISNAHPQVHSYNFGQEFEIAASEQEKYPLVWCDVAPATIEQKTLSIVVSFLVCDIQTADNRNEKDTLSDTLSISQDIIAEIKNPAYADNFLINESIQLTAIRGGLPDFVNGWKFDINFEVAFTSNRCQVPN